MSEYPKTMIPSAENAGCRLDRFLVSELPELSRARVQQLIEGRQVLVNGAPQKASLRLRGGEHITLIGTPQAPALRAIAEEIPLEVLYEDDDLAVVNKPAGMMVHAGAGATDDARNRGTLVNALLHRFGSLSEAGGGLRPGIVHRLDRNTSGLMVVAKNDLAHRKLSEQFACRQVHKTYIALVHGWLKEDAGTIGSAIGRDAIRRTRMTTRRSGGRAAVSHWKVRERIAGRFGKFTLLEVTIETGRTHQIRVHLSSVGHPVVGDTLYGAPGRILPVASPANARAGKSHAGGREKDLNSEPAILKRNFLHAAVLEFPHPRSGKIMKFTSPLPPELEAWAAQIRPSRAPLQI